MKRFTIALFFLASVAHAAIPTTTVNGKIYTPGGVVAAAGSITASLSQPGTVIDDTVSSTTYRVSGSKSGTIASDGTVTGLVLVPNDTIVPANTSYKVTITVTSPVAASWTEYWSITSSPDPIQVGSITRLNAQPPQPSGVMRVQDEGVDLAQLGKLNLTGSAVACSNDTANGRITCNVTGGGGGGDALTTSPLSQFAATTSAQLAAVLSDESGTGVFVRNTSPTFVTPALGTPASGVATNLTGTAAGLTAGAASALAADPANCSSGQAAGGITAAGLGEACIDPIVNLGTDPAGTLPTANGGTGLTSLATGRIPYGAGSSALNSSDDVKASGMTILLGSATAPNGKATIGPGTFILSENDNGGLDAISGANSLAIASSVTGGVITLYATGVGTNIVISPGPGGIFYVDNAQVLGSANLQNGYFVPHQGTNDPTVCTYLGETFLNTTSNLWKKNTNASPPACTWASIGGSASAVGAARVYQRTDGSGALQASTMSESADGKAVITTATSIATASNTGPSGTGNGVKYAGNANQTVDTNCSQWTGSFGITETDDTAGFDPVICADGADYFRPPVPTATANKPVLSTTTSGDTAFGPVMPTAGTTDSSIIGSSGAYVEKALPTGGTNGCAGTNDKLGYNTTTHAWTCGTDQTGAGGSGDVTDVGPGCATGACFTDGVATTGTDMIVWEGTTADASEFRVAAPAADPASDVTVTFPNATDTLVGKATTDTLTNKTMDVEATGNTLTTTWKFNLGAVARCNAGAGAAGVWDNESNTNLTASCANGTNTLIPYMSFADTASPVPYIGKTIQLPSDYTGVVDFDLLWRTSATSGDVKWKIDYVCVTDGATIDPALNNAGTMTDTAKGTTLQLNGAQLNGITLSGCSVRDAMYVQVSRDGTATGDTIAAAADLFWVGMTFRRAM